MNRNSMLAGVVVIGVGAVFVLFSYGISLFPTNIGLVGLVLIGVGTAALVIKM